MLGSIFSAGASLLGGFLNNESADDRQDDSQSFNAEQFATRYQTTVKDMQAAGLNPMLAYGQGGGNGATSSAASSAGYPDIGANITQSRIASAQIANISADTENKKAQADLIAAQAAQAWSSADQSRANIGQINATTEKIVAETKNIPIEGDRLRYAIQTLAEQAALMAQQGETQAATRKQIEATIAKLKSTFKKPNVTRIGKYIFMPHFCICSCRD